MECGACWDGRRKRVGVARDSIGLWLDERVHEGAINVDKGLETGMGVRKVC